MQKDWSNGRGARSASWLILGLSIATAASAACIRPKASCAGEGGFCRGFVTACEEGWEDASEGLVCQYSERRKAKCYLVLGCAPYPCSHPPSGCQYPATNCREGGQCCCCSFVSGEPEETEFDYWFFFACLYQCPAPGGGGGED